MNRLSDRFVQMRKNIEIERQSNPEEFALREYVIQLKAKKLTPEAFYRLIDWNYTKKISIAAFKDKIKQFGIRLTDTQTRRLALIFDEDLEGNITYAEYQNALEAFKMSGEKHINCEDIGKAYRPFEIRTMDYILRVLMKKGITIEQLYD